MPAPTDSIRCIAVVGASTLRGKEIQQLLGESVLAAAEFRLFDDATADGTLTEAGGEPAFIRQVEEESFEKADLAFFACGQKFTARHWPQAARSGAVVIDLSGAFADVQTALPWIPGLDEVLPPPRPPVGKLLSSPGTLAIVGASLAAGLSRLPVSQIGVTFLRPVTERGTEGVQELERQTVSLLSFQPQPQEVFGTQVAFNLLPEYGEICSERLKEVRSAAAREVVRYLAGRVPPPAIQIVQAPVFYGYAFSAFVQTRSPVSAVEIEGALGAAGIRFPSDGDPVPDNVNAANQENLLLARPERDPSAETVWWLWGVADNIRLAARNAVRIAEKILAKE